MSPSGKKISFRKPKQIESLELHFGIRLFAFIVDIMIINIFIVRTFTMLTDASVGWYAEPNIGHSEVNLLPLIIYWFYFALFEGLLGATPGKLFVRLRVYNADGTRLSIRKAVLRFPLKVISIVSLLGILMIDINREKRGLHDLLSGTIVRKYRSR